jgi:hypothetical protein
MWNNLHVTVNAPPISLVERMLIGFKIARTLVDLVLISCIYRHIQASSV